ncbi:hypothetical protein MASR1M59_16370 [Melaminivora sp.]
MYLVAIAWLYVTVMMAAAEASAPGGTLLGAGLTLVLYGLLPLALLLYILATPARKRARRTREQQQLHAWEQQQRCAAAPPSSPSSHAPDEGRHAPGAAQGELVTSVGKKP